MTEYYEDMRRRFDHILGLSPHICPICGKKFECTTAYVYKIRRDKRADRFDYFCSYTCFRIRQKEMK